MMSTNYNIRKAPFTDTEADFGYPHVGATIPAGAVF